MLQLCNPLMNKAVPIIFIKSSICQPVTASVMSPFVHRTKEQSVEPTEFTNEMDELFSWIDETENIIGSSLRPNIVYLEALLEKVKVGGFPFAVIVSEKYEIRS